MPGRSGQPAQGKQSRAIYMYISIYNVLIYLYMYIYISTADVDRSALELRHVETAWPKQAKSGSISRRLRVGSVFA